MIIFMTVFIILSAGIAGCSSPASSSPAPSVSPVPAQILSTVAPSEMALQPLDFPGNFSLLEKGERTTSEMRDWALDHGWKGGYYTVFEKNERDSPSGTIIEQVISVYPAENITLIVPDTRNSWKNWPAEDRNVTVEELSLPAIGDSSRAMKASDTSDNSQMYMIAFVKYNVYEQLSTNGTATDYETLRQMAGIAAGKIR